MGSLGNVLLKDLRRMIRDPASLFIAISIPLVVGGMLRLLNSNEGKPIAKLIAEQVDIYAFLCDIFQMTPDQS